MDGVSDEGGTLSAGGSDTAIREENTAVVSEPNCKRDRHCSRGAPHQRTTLFGVSDYPRLSYIVTETPTTSG